MTIMAAPGWSSRGCESKRRKDATRVGSSCAGRAAIMMDSGAFVTTAATADACWPTASSSMGMASPRVDAMRPAILPGVRHAA